MCEAIIHRVSPFHQPPSPPHLFSQLKSVLNCLLFVRFLIDTKPSRPPRGKGRSPLTFVPFFRYPRTCPHVGKSVILLPLTASHPMDTYELWQSALGELELKLSKANFTTWFRQTFISIFHDGEVIIGVPNTFTKAWMEKKYHREITMCLQNLTNNTVKCVSYKVETQQGSPQEIPTKEELRAAKEQEERSTYTDLPSFTPSHTLTHQEIEPVGLNDRYRFSSFVVGKQNELAFAAAQAVSAQPGGVYNPLFIYGGVGLGKTHILQGIGHEIREQNPAANILYATCERFTNEFIDAVR